MKSYNASIRCILPGFLCLFVLSVSGTLAQERSWIPSFIADAFKSDLEEAGIFRAHLRGGVYVDLTFDEERAFFTIAITHEDSSRQSDQKHWSQSREGLSAEYTRKDAYIYFDDSVRFLGAGNVAVIGELGSVIEMKGPDTELNFYPVLQTTPSGTFVASGDKFVREGDTLERSELNSYMEEYFDFQAEQHFFLDSQLKVLVEKPTPQLLKPYDYFIKPLWLTEGFLWIQVTQDLTVATPLQAADQNWKFKWSAEGYTSLNHEQFAERLKREQKRIEEDRKAREAAEAEAREIAKRAEEEQRRQKQRELEAQKAAQERELERLRLVEERKLADALAEKAKLESQIFGFGCMNNEGSGNPAFFGKEYVDDVSLNYSLNTEAGEGTVTFVTNNSELLPATKFFNLLNPYRFDPLDGWVVLATTSFQRGALLSSKVGDDIIEATKYLRAEFIVNRKYGSLLKYSISVKEPVPVEHQKALKQIISSLGLKYTGESELITTTLDCKKVQNLYEIEKNGGASYPETIVWTAATYPRKAAVRDVGGWCIVTGTVTETGLYVDKKIDSCSLNGEEYYFDRVSLKAADKRRYFPRFENGSPAKTENYKSRYTFGVEK